MSTFVTTQANRSLSDNGRYIEFIESALHSQRIFSSFKQVPVYKDILEHVTPELGLEYLRIVATENPTLLLQIEKFRINDLVGSPTIVDYPVVGKISPSTTRYIKVASDLLLRFGDLSGMRIAEIGVGYGGQLLILDQVCHFINYHIYDLPPVLELSGKYLESHILNGSYKKCTLNQADGSVQYDLAISNYAFSELPSHLQLKYIEKVLSRSTRGYMTMNSGRHDSPYLGNFLTIDQLQSLLPPFTITEENPRTAANFILTWDSSSTKANQL